MEDLIPISNLNDFIFCPISIYFHNLYEDIDKIIFQTTVQIDGTNAHESIDSGRYSSKKDILQGLSVYSDRYKIYGKIDILDTREHLLTERKKKIITIYDGYIFQLYAQYFALKEMGYEVKKIRLYSMDDNKTYPIALPEEDNEMFFKFVKVVNDIRNFVPQNFMQTNTSKCLNCIYEPACDRACARDDEHKRL